VVKAIAVATGFTGSEVLSFTPAGGVIAAPAPAPTPAPAPGPQPAAPAPSVEPDGIKVTIDGKALAFDVPPQNINGRVLVPLRAIFEEMGAAIDYDPDTRTVTAIKGGTVVVLTIGDTSPTVNGAVVAIDQPGVIVDGRTLAPLRFVAEAFSGTVVWEATSQTAAIATR
jgi:N-acetylmuramoyl-L-alanine amidase